MTPRCVANINTREVTRTAKYNDIEMLTFTIKNPIVNIPVNPLAERKINEDIEMQIDEYFMYVTRTLYYQAVNDYMDSIRNNFPFHPYEVYMEYTITYNDNCFLSLYADRYEFTGGAHGSTVRTSNTWELCTGRDIYLYYFFRPSIDYRHILIQEIINQAEENLIENPGIYFDDYQNLIISNFNTSSFYMSPDGIIIYYQQYDIAPYSTGIVEFTIPYEIIGWYPSC